MILYKCPHCYGEVQIIEMNCKIFRHGIYKKNNQQLDPHASEKICKQVFEEGLIYGCGKPFTIVENKAVKCDYI